MFLCMSANLCLVTVLSLEQCSEFDRFRLQHVQMVNKTSSFKTKLICNKAETSRVNLLMFTFPTSYAADFPLEITALPVMGRVAGALPLITSFTYFITNVCLQRDIFLILRADGIYGK